LPACGIVRGSGIKAHRKIRTKPARLQYCKRKLNKKPPEDMNTAGMNTVYKRKRNAGNGRKSE
jgi:hypothetical protein